MLTPTLHGLQRAMSVTVVALGAALPFLPPRFGVYDLAAAAVLLAVNHELGKATEIKGDTSPNPPAIVTDTAGNRFPVTANEVKS